MVDGFYSVWLNKWVDWALDRSKNDRHCHDFCVHVVFFAVSCTFSCMMKFTVKDCDPNTGEADEEGYEDEYVVRTEHWFLCSLFSCKAWSGRLKRLLQEVKRSGQLRLGPGNTAENRFPQGPRMRLIKFCTNKLLNLSMPRWLHLKAGMSCQHCSGRPGL